MVLIPFPSFSLFVQLLQKKIKFFLYEGYRTENGKIGVNTCLFFQPFSLLKLSHCF